MILVLDSGWVVSSAERATGVVALFLEGPKFAVKPAQEVHDLGKSAEIGFDVVGIGDFLEENLGEASGGGLEADFGQLGGVLTAEMIDQMVLVEAVLEDEVLFQAPFEMAASGPT